MITFSDSVMIGPSGVSSEKKYPPIVTKQPTNYFVDNSTDGLFECEVVHPEPGTTIFCEIQTKEQGGDWKVVDSSSAVFSGAALNFSVTIGGSTVWDRTNVRFVFSAYAAASTYSTQSIEADAIYTGALYKLTVGAGSNYYGYYPGATNGTLEPSMIGGSSISWFVNADDGDDRNSINVGDSSVKAIVETKDQSWEMVSEGSTSLINRDASLTGLFRSNVGNTLVFKITIQ